MRRVTPAATPLDPEWMQLLSDRCAELRGGGARFEDLYIEQRLEIRAARTSNDFDVASCRLEGAAARWRSPTRTILHARTGLSPRFLGELLGRQADRVALPPLRQAQPAEMKSPQGWLDWARQVASRVAPAPSVIRFISRRAAVIRSDGWVGISTPPLVHVERTGDQPVALLAVWGHPQLAHWLSRFLEPRPPKTWEPSAGTQLPVLFTDGTAGTLLHELVGHLVESDLVANGASPLSGLMGATIAPTTLDVCDDPTRRDLPGSFDHDDEGVEAKPLSLVESGRLNGFLCDREGSARLNGPPGRGRRSVWSKLPVTRQSNLVIKPGECPTKELEGGLDHALVVTRVGGAMVDPNSSRTVVRVERGWEVRHGRRRRQLAPCELTGSALELLANIDSRIGSNPVPDWRLGWCIKDGVPLPTGSEAPAVLVNRLEVL